jgi:hypothetical protein
MIKYIILAIILFVAIYLFYIIFVKQERFDATRYLVQNQPDNEEAVDLLAKLYNNIKLTIYYAEEKMNISKSKVIKSQEDIDLLKFEQYLKTILGKINYVTIRESIPKSKYTSYSVNKGEEIVFCIRSKETNQLHNINDLMYVALHEIAHIGCPELDHTPLFYEINKFLLRMAMEINVYRYHNYSSQPLSYCGLMLTSNVLG